MRTARLVRHLTALHWRTRLAFPRSTLRAIEEALATAQRMHTGAILVAIETSLPLRELIGDAPPRARAAALFAALRAWDTEHRNGVLIYLQMADRSLEIVADRGLSARASRGDWEAVCRLMEEHFRHGRFKGGALAGIDAVAGLLARHFPTPPAPATAAAAPIVSQRADQLPHQATLL
jgi:uncharacterized membrane protein